METLTIREQSGAKALAQDIAVHLTAVEADDACYVLVRDGLRRVVRDFAQDEEFAVLEGNSFGRPEGDFTLTDDDATFYLVLGEDTVRFYTDTHWLICELAGGPDGWEDSGRRD